MQFNNTLKGRLLETSEKLEDQNELLDDSLKKLLQANDNVKNVNKELKLQTTKIDQSNQMNKTLNTHYDRSNKLLGSIKCKEILYKLILILLIIGLGLADIIMIFIKMK